MLITGGNKPSFETDSVAELLGDDETRKINITRLFSICVGESTHLLLSYINHSTNATCIVSCIVSHLC